MGTPIVKLDNISLSYGSNPVLKDIGITVFKGDYIGLIGPNGGGKTTLLKIMLGLLKPDTGNIELFNQDIKDFRDWTRFGYLPQRLIQTDTRFPITVQEVVGQGRIGKIGLFKRFAAADIKAVEKALELCEVEQLRNRLLSDLSSGQRQRVFIARALASEPEVLILDEPSTGIDVASQSRFYRFLKELNTEQKITIVFVSHDIDVLSHEASRFICVNQRLVFDGSASLAFQENKDLLKDLYGENVKYLFHSC